MHKATLADQLSICLHPVSQWRIVGAVRMNNFGHEVERLTFAQLLERANSLPWQFKNGKQQWHIQDLDHGSHRMWMSPNHSMSVTQ